ncbi:MAG: hypothetical protein AB9882_02265 [Ignavibacteriaceae bacterium]
MNLKKTILSSIVTGMLFIGLLKAQEISDLNLAKSYFNELDSLCRLDNGNLWEIKLYGATMFVFPENRLIIANESDKDRILVNNGGLYLGKLPENINIANTSIEWNGKNWTMVSWGAISESDKYSRGKLLIHESWHRNQKEIGIVPVMTENTYLDELQGSILLKLEFIVLSRALYSDGDNKVNHLTNALTIRAYRQLLFSKNNENVFELHEGMAEYTGFKLCGLDNKLLPKVVAKQLELAMDKEGLANSFPYLTGPAYGLLFDELKENWLNDVKKGKSLPEIGSDIIKSNIPSDTILLKENIEKIIVSYGADSLIIRETEKFENQHQLINKYKQKFFGDDILIIKNNNINMSFNPQEKLVPVENGIVYKTMRLTGEWGIAEVKNGIFRSNDWQFFIISAPSKNKTGTINEVDYDLMLNDGWEVVEIKKGKYTLKK